MKNIVFKTCSIVLLFFFSYPAILFAADNLNYKYPSNNKILVYAPGYNSPNDEQDEIADDAKEYFDLAAHFTDDIKTLKDTKASVEAVTSFSNYGTVIIQTHGWFWKDPLLEKTPGFRSGTIVPYPFWYLSEAGARPDDLVWYLDKRRAMDLYEGRLAVSKNPDGNSNFHYVVFPSYIDRYVPKLKDTFFYLGICDILQNDKLWDVLEKKGAKLAFGWDETVFRDTSVAFFNELMLRMLPDNKTVEPLTAQQALSDIPWKEGLTYDNNDKYKAYAKVIFKHSPEWENFIYKEDNNVVLEIKLAVTWDNKSQSPPSEVVGLAQYILWDVNQNKSFDVFKQNGGKWIYPISESDYQNGFHDDLINMVATNIEKTGLAPLLERVYSKTDPYAKDVRSPFRSPYYLTPVLYPINYSLMRRARGAKALANQQIWRLGGWFDYHPRPSYTDIESDNYSEQLPNSFGGTDSYDQSQSMNKTFSIEDHYDSGEKGRVYNISQTITESTNTITNTPDGGFGLNIDSGWPSLRSSGTGYFTSLETPFYTDDSYLRVLNDSSAELFNFSVGVRWEGTSSIDERYDHTLINRIWDGNPDPKILSYWYSNNKTYTSSINNEYSGTGNFTTALGATGTISYYSLETGQLNTWSAVLPHEIQGGNSSPPLGTDPPEWFASYSMSNRKLHYLYRPTSLTSGFDVTDNFVTIILSETIATGSKTVYLEPPAPPIPYYNSWKNRWVVNFDSAPESDITYEVDPVAYNVKAILTRVENANTQNPWALPSNTTLESALRDMIRDFRSDSGFPSDHFGETVDEDADYWNINFSLKKLSW